MSSTESSPTLRMRVFAGPNGSGKSTIIKYVRSYEADGYPIDFGIYINADDIGYTLRKGRLNFLEYELEVSDQEFHETAIASGLINEDFPVNVFRLSYQISRNSLQLVDQRWNDRLAQITADYLRKKLLLKRKKFSFETVFSHASKLDIMRKAVAEGYKVYLYFVSTESPEINKERVLKRVAEKGHSVPPDRIVARYYRSLDFLYEAAQLAYQTFFFDNSGTEPVLIQHFKVQGGKKVWDDVTPDELPQWFIDYYVDKQYR